MRSLSYLICKTLHVDKDSEAFYDVMGCTCKYLIGVTSAFEFQHTLKELVDLDQCDVSAKRFRLMVLDMGRYTLNLKLYLYHIIKTRRVPNRYKTKKQFYCEAAKLANVKPVDAGSSFRALKKEFAKIRKHEKVEELTREIVNPSQRMHWHLKFSEVVYSQIITTIRQITYTKLRFISSSTNIDLSDLHSELMIKALLAYYRLVPTMESDAFIVNFIRRSISNHAKNVIKTYTSQKRGRMINAGVDGFGGSNYDLIVVSENQFKKQSGDSDSGNMSYENLYDATATSTSATAVESKLSLKALRRKYKPFKNKYLVLRLVLGDEHEGFTQYLRSKGHLRKGSNSDFQDRCPAEMYRELISGYTGVKLSSIEKFMRTIEYQYFAENKVKRYAECA